MARFCIDCGIKHLVQDCPMHPDKKGKTSLNYVTTLPSTSTPSSSESDRVVPLQAITRAQAQAIAEKGKRKIQEETEPEATPSEHTRKSKETWKQRRARRAASKKKRAEKGQAAVHETIQQTQANKTENPLKDTPNETLRQDREQSAGSVLVDKIHEPLDALLKAYEARLKPLETMEDRWRNYLDAALESRQLELHKRLILVVILLSAPGSLRP